jgi:AcrR family transcriptional regulator
VTAAPTRAARGAATVVRLLDAASSILGAEGAGAVSVQRVADMAGTSKALVHYHFDGKDALLVACAHRLADQLLDAEARALHGTTPAAALDDLWNGLMHDHVRSLRRALLALMSGATPGTGVALAEISARRRTAAVTTLGVIERMLSFTPRVSRVPLAGAFVAVIDGLTIDCASAPNAEHRAVFDAFWLALLSLDG